MSVLGDMLELGPSDIGTSVRGDTGGPPAPIEDVESFDSEGKRLVGCCLFEDYF